MSDITEVTPNTAELVAIYQHIKTHPEEWDQQVWTRKTDCGTAFCFAGHACARAGAEPLSEDDQINVSYGAEIMMLNGVRWYISDLAMELLGLDDIEADSLFASGNGIDDLREIIRSLTGVDPESVTA